jgi:predicted nucleotidyltransferase
MSHRLTPSEQRLLLHFTERLLAASPPGAVAAVRVFGSRARGTAHAGSDLDLAVELTSAEHRDVVHRLAAEIADDTMASLDLYELGLAPVVLPPGPATGLRAAIARDGIDVWRHAA